MRLVVVTLLAMRAFLRLSSGSVEQPAGGISSTGELKGKLKGKLEGKLKGQLKGKLNAQLKPKLNQS